MRHLYLLPIFLLLEFLPVATSVSQSWAWISGSSTTTIVPDFGTRGQYSPSNQPPGLRNAAMWFGPDGRLYLFGGDGESSNRYNTLWVYDPTLGEWMWKRGSNIPNAARVSGTVGYPSETNDPGARSEFGWSATPSGDLWIYGGLSPSSDVYADLWKYDFALDRWISYDVSANTSLGTTLNLDADFGGAGSYANGQLGHPGSRYGAKIYADEDSGMVWLFCGVGFSSGSPGCFEDVWQLDFVNANAHIVGGGAVPDDGGSYPLIQGIESAGDYPPARRDHSLWKTSNGRFYIFGGRDPAGNYLSDMWYWNSSNHKWAWVGGAGIPNDSLPQYYSQGVADARTRIGPRYGSATWAASDGQLAIYGGFGKTGTSSFTHLNDFFLWDPVHRVPTWIGGDSDLSSINTRRPTFGTKGVPSASNYPGSRFYASTAVDARGQVWLFGGTGYATTENAGFRNDLFVLSYPVAGIFAGGQGTAESPYQVATLDQLQAIKDYPDKHFILTADINASATATWNLSNDVFRGFVPIGTGSVPFTGTLDGGGHSISRLTINRGSTSAVGLIGRLDGEVKNLVLDSVNVLGDNYVGGLSGRDLGSIENCSVRGTVIGGGSAVGGLTGDLFTGSIDKCYAAVNVSGGVFSGSGMGGLAGSVSSGSVISDSYAAGNVVGDDRVGGLVGNNDGSISRCYAAGVVVGDGNVGGLVGKNTGTVSNGFWNSELSGQSSSDGGTGESVQQMRQQATYAGFDFGGTWILWEGLSYPSFRGNLQSPPPGLTGTAIAVTRNDSAYHFNGTHVGLAFTGIGVDSTVYVYTQLDMNEADDVGFVGTPPLYHADYRWIIARTGSGFTNAALTITDLVGLPRSPDPVSIKLYYRSTVGMGNFSLIPSTYGAESVAATVSAFGEYIFASDSANWVPLLVELASFTAFPRPSAIELKWKTATESNSYGFEVQRSVISHQSSGKKWGKVGFVASAGTSNASKAYNYTDATVNGKVSYRLKQIDRDGQFKYSQEIEAEAGSVPKVFALEQNYPNPFNPTTTIGFTLQTSGLTTLKVYDAIGREVATLVNEALQAGVHYQKTFDGSNVSSGVYFARLSSNGKQSIKKLMLMK